MKSNKNKFHEVTEKIRDAIVFNEFEPGMALGENMLAEKFQVSRTLIREALKRLETESLVDVIFCQGAFVSEIRFKDIKEVSSLIGKHASW